MKVTKKMYVHATPRPAWSTPNEKDPHPTHLVTLNTWEDFSDDYVCVRSVNVDIDLPEDITAIVTVKRIEKLRAAIISERAETNANIANMEEQISELLCLEDKS